MQWKDEYLKRVKEAWWYETLATEDPEFTEEIVHLLGTQSLRERPEAYQSEQDTSSGLL